mmetsp:Transcript_22850/g.35765  ORF Transcript_22850/g.35765 Transcript_22850/m.35765 type:complete len:154 (-) Transcript_22850:477-938(-)
MSNTTSHTNAHWPATEGDDYRFVIMVGAIAAIVGGSCCFGACMLLKHQNRKARKLEEKEGRKQSTVEDGDRSSQLEQTPVVPAGLVPWLSSIDSGSNARGSRDLTRSSTTSVQFSIRSQEPRNSQDSGASVGRSQFIPSQYAPPASLAQGIIM